MVELTDEQIEAANERGRVFRESHPHARSARYDAKAGRVVVELVNGATLPSLRGWSRACTTPAPSRSPKWK